MPLLSESDYKKYCDDNKFEIQKLRNDHQLSQCDCNNHNFVSTQSIRKRAKLSVQEKLEISFDLGRGKFR
jgi:hypothetical protein